MELHLGAECCEIAWWDSTVLGTAVEQLNDVNLHQTPMLTPCKQLYPCWSFRLQIMSTLTKVQDNCASTPAAQSLHIMAGSV